MFKQNPDKNNFIKTTFIIYIFCVFIFCLIQVIDYSIVRPIDITDIDENNIVEWEIDMVNIDSHYIAIGGYAFILNEKLTKFDVNVILENSETKEAIILPTMLYVREDLNEIFPDGTDYSQYGFLSRVNKYLIDYENNSYEIYLKYFNNEHSFFIKANMILNEFSGE